MLLRMRRIFNILIISVLCALTACGGKDKFVLKGTLAGGETQSLRFVYYANGAIQTINGAARDGVFVIEGRSAEPTIVEILSNEGRAIGHIYVQNGDEIECEISRHAPWEIKLKGTDINERWSAFIGAQAASFAKGDTLAINKAVADYAAAHPDDIVSALLLVTAYDASRNPAEAAAVLEELAPEAKPMQVIESFATMLASATAPADTLAPVRYYVRRDTLERLDMHAAAYSLLSFMSTERDAPRPDSVIDFLRKTNAQYPRRKLRVLDLSLGADTFVWRRVIRPDSAKWQQAWLPGGITSDGLQNAAISRLPWFVLVDSAGAVIYRGPSCSAVDSAIRRAVGDNK